MKSYGKKTFMSGLETYMRDLTDVTANSLRIGYVGEHIEFFYDNDSIACSSQVKPLSSVARRVSNWDKLHCLLLNADLSVLAVTTVHVNAGLRSSIQSDGLQPAVEALINQRDVAKANRLRVVDIGVLPRGLIATDPSTGNPDYCNIVCIMAGDAAD